MKDLELKWAGKSYYITSSEAFAACDAVEEHVTLIDISTMDEKPRFTLLAKAYSALLVVAGAPRAICTPAQVHKVLTSEMKKMKPEEEVSKEDVDASFMLQAMNDLVEVLMDGAPEGIKEDGGDGAGGDEGAGKKAAS